MSKRIYASAEEMFSELKGCGCCVDDYENGFEELKAMILEEAGVK